MNTPPITINSRSCNHLHSQLYECLPENNSGPEGVSYRWSPLGPEVFTHRVIYFAFDVTEKTGYDPSVLYGEHDERQPISTQCLGGSKTPPLYPEYRENYSLKDWYFFSCI